MIHAISYLTIPWFYLLALYPTKLIKRDYFECDTIYYYTLYLY